MTNNGLTNMMKNYAKISVMAKPVIVDAIVPSALKQISYLSEILQPMRAFQAIYFSEITRLNDVAKEISAAFADLQSSVVSSLEILESISKLSLDNDCISAVTSLQKTMSMVNKVITPEISDVLSSYAKLKTQALEEIDFAMSDIIYTEDKLVFEGIEYDEEELRAEYTKEIEELRQENPVEKFKKKYWLIGLIFTVIIYIPQWSQTLDFYKDCPQKIEQFIKTTIWGEKIYLNVIKENAFIRDEANSRSTVIITVKYAEPLEVIDKVPYWYKVKYITEEKEYTGWISKISVGTEDDIND